MAIAIETSGGGAPYAKFVNLGDTLTGAYAGSLIKQQTNFETKLPALKPDGKPLKEEVLYLIAMPGTTASTGTEDGGYHPIEAGAQLRYSVSGFRWGQLIEALRNLPALNGFAAGQSASGDLISITLIGWSAETKNPDRAKQAGFTVIGDRIVMRTDDERDAYVLHQSKSGGKTTVAKDFTVEVRRPTAADKALEQAADAWYLSKPWDKATSSAASADADSADDDEPF